jgi:hypothetical protein
MVSRKTPLFWGEGVENGIVRKDNVWQRDSIFIWSSMEKDSSCRIPKAHLPLVPLTRLQSVTLQKTVI